MGYHDLLYFEPYSPTPLKPLSCSMATCVGTVPIDLSRWNNLRFKWVAASANDDIFISVTGSGYARFDFRAKIDDCFAPYQHVTGDNISFELDDGGLGFTQKYAYQAEYSFISLGACDGCAGECELFTRMLFDHDLNGELNMKFKSLTYSAQYDPKRIAQASGVYNWNAIEVRMPQGGSINLEQINPDSSLYVNADTLEGNDSKGVHEVGAQPISPSLSPQSPENIPSANTLDNSLFRSPMKSSALSANGRPRYVPLAAFVVTVHCTITYLI